MPGKDMYVADTSPHAFIQGEPDSELLEDIEVMVHSAIAGVPATLIKIENIRQATAEDPILQGLCEVVMERWPERIEALDPALCAFWHIRDEVTYAEGILFAGKRLIVPKVLRSEMLCLLHEGHIGAEKSKARARNVMYWPGLTKETDQQVESCSVSLKYRASNAREPMLMYEMPGVPFLKVAMDILGFQAVDFLVVVDYYSKYPELARLEHAESAAAVITHVKSVFTHHGIPEEVADNMPFDSFQFCKFVSVWGCTVTTSSPRYP